MKSLKNSRRSINFLQLDFSVCGHCRLMAIDLPCKLTRSSPRFFQYADFSRPEFFFCLSSLGVDVKMVEQRRKTTLVRR